MRSYACILPFIVTFGLAWPHTGIASTYTMDAIDTGFREGRIDYETALVYKAYAIFDPSKLPAAYQGEAQLIKCATPILSEIRDHWEDFSPAVRLALAEHIQARPSLQHSYVSPSGSFRVHYDLSGWQAVHPADIDGDGVPDYVEQGAAILDSIWVLEIDELGYHPPPSDDNHGGGPGYDVYILELGRGGVYGYTYDEPGYGGKCPSYMQLDNDYQNTIYPTRGLDALRVTAAHEFFHAIQFGYCADQYNMRWWMEICSTWMEDIAYDHINDYYNYLDTFFDNPGASLDRMRSPTDYYPYGASVFAHYIEERFGRDKIREIWEGIKRIGRFDFEILDDVLPVGLSAAVQEFAVWNYFTGSRARLDLYYPEGAHYPEMRIRPQNEHMAFPVEHGILTADHLGSQYIRFYQSRPGNLVVQLAPTDRRVWTWQILAYNDSESHVIPVEGWAEEVSSWKQYIEVLAIPTVTAFQGEYYACSYSAEIQTKADTPPATALRQNAPNPLVLGKLSKTTIPFDLSEYSEVTITIYSITGQRVRKFDLGSLWPASYRDLVEWDGKDASGKSVAAGIYFYKIQAGDFSAIQKMMVLWDK